MNDEKVEQRARQAQQQLELNARRSEDWHAWFRQCLYAEFKSGNPIFDGIGEAFSTERAGRRKELQHAIEEERRSIDAKLQALEQRVKNVPGKLPIAKTWQPETVVYQAEFVSHEGALWQARKDTAQTPGGADWVCVARAGRDALTPTIRGTYDVYAKYQKLDVIVSDGAAFIASKDDPGLCPGSGWQMLSRQGKRGQRGEKGERGPKGDQGPPGEWPQLVSSEIDENYNLTILRSDNSLEIIPLRPAFERFVLEIDR
jgi:hypothetical protein